MLQDLKEKNPWKAGVFFVGKLVLFCVEQFNPPPKKNTQKHTSQTWGVCPQTWIWFVKMRVVLFKMEDGWILLPSYHGFIYFWIFFRCLEILAQKKNTIPSKWWVFHGDESHGIPIRTKWW